MPRNSKSLRLSGAAQSALVEATADLPAEATTSQRVLTLTQRLRDRAHAPSAGGVSREELAQALQALRFQLLSDFADAG